MSAEIPFKQLNQADIVDYKSSQWHHTDWQTVIVLYKSDKYVIVSKLSNNTEHCINIGNYKESHKPQFRMLGSETELKQQGTKYSVCIQSHRVVLQHDIRIARAKTQQ